MTMSPPGPARMFLRAESAGAGVLVAAIAAALAWANLAPAGYAHFWNLNCTVQFGPLGVALSLRDWVNSGLMTLFFLVVGLEARREIDLGDLRDHRRLILPAAAGLVGMALPVLIYLGVNGGGPGAHGWGAAMSTDTALALGVFTVVGRGVPDRVRKFVLTVFVVDDIVALVVIAVAYSGDVKPLGLAVAGLAYAGVLLGRRRLAVFAVMTVAVWGGLLASGIDPVVAGLAAGLATSAYLPKRVALTEATTLVRLFREQPTPELARSAAMGLNSTLSANARLQHAFHRATSFVVVPLFALANAGITLDPEQLFTPVAIGIFAAYVLGKPIAVVATSWLITVLSKGKLRPSVGWAAVLGSGAIAGVGFTVSLLIADLAFTGPQLDQAKTGVLASAVGAALLSLVVYRVTAALPVGLRTRLLVGKSSQLTDLVPPVDVARDHVRGPEDAAVTVVEYGDFECPWTGMAAPTARELLADNDDIRYVWRHLPLPDVHPHAQLAAEAAEAAGAQGQFWAMHDMLLANQTDLAPDDLTTYAELLGLDVERFRDDLRRRATAVKVAQDVESADLSGVAGTPTFFINGRRHEGPQDLTALNDVIQAARTHAVAFATV
ncbi:Na+/H+ antiporter NhaA [Kutzneria sp. CA-103260]|uniref:Na+/H+ antiporter NhaA n=1 Tax=Kutzneria sp. CA-103260 TaxID=2802641 RepID=UPI001BAD1592|nr:Na+/H+ antiporter NhaA [Kutzneria sp. CA-103260]